MSVWKMTTAKRRLTSSSMKRAVSSARAYGLMQLVVPTGILTAKKYGVDRAVTADSLFEPRLNIQLGTAFFKEQIDKYGRIEYVAAAYNAGPKAVAKYKGIPPYAETQSYVHKVLDQLEDERKFVAESSGS